MTLSLICSLPTVDVIHHFSIHNFFILLSSRVSPPFKMSLSHLLDYASMLRPYKAAALCPIYLCIHSLGLIWSFRGIVLQKILSMECRTARNSMPCILPLIISWIKTRLALWIQDTIDQMGRKSKRALNSCIENELLCKIQPKSQVVCHSLLWG